MSYFAAEVPPTFYIRTQRTFIKVYIFDLLTINKYPIPLRSVANEATHSVSRPKVNTFCCIIIQLDGYLHIRLKRFKIFLPDNMLFLLVSGITNRLKCQSLLFFSPVVIPITDLYTSFYKKKCGSIYV